MAACEGCHKAASREGRLEHRLGRMAAVGDTVEEGGWQLEVTALDRRRISEVRLTPLPGEEVAG